MSTPAPLLRCRLAESSEELENAVTFHYLAEGAANVAYTIRRYSKTAPAPNGKPFVFKSPGPKPSPSPKADDLTNQVLRISKGLPKTLSAQAIHHHFSLDIVPLFSAPKPKSQNSPHPSSSSSSSSSTDHLMDLHLVALDAAVFDALNQEIAQHSSRGTAGITPGTHGILMENMSSQPGRSVTIEFKPKWLAQTPNPPRNATRCRTCAMEASKVSRGKTPQVPYICPLRFFRGDTAVITPFIERKVRDACAGWENEPRESPTEQQVKAIVDSIVEWLVSGQGHALLATLRDIQLRHDEHGVTSPISHTNPGPDLLPIAMTLRDCSLFIRAVYNPHPSKPNPSNPTPSATASPQNSSTSSPHPLIEAKLGDLDFKSAAKRKDWEAKEQSLRDGGWYTERAGAVPWSFGDCGVHVT